MTDINHRRSRRHTSHTDKSMQGWSDRGALSGVGVSASIPNDFTNGHRGMARAAAGAKKFVRTRIRFHENAETKRLAAEIHPDDTDEDLDPVGSTT